MKQLITDAQYVNAYRSAGLWFVGMYMEAFLLRFDELEDKDKKTKLIDEIYDHGRNADENLRGTKTRVNALHRIIKAGREMEALETVINSNKVDKEAVSIAKDLLSRINSGDFIYKV
ncbi:MAG: hypothetical protein PHG06_14945 [Parabacteroides sp.]|nr:hypothetical protein [Parabacteroides sp.]